MTDNNIQNIDNGFRRLATVASFSSLFAYAVILAITPASLNEIARYYHPTQSQLGLIYGVFMLAFLVAVLSGGWYSDRLGKLPIMLVGGVFMGIGAFIFSRSSYFSTVFIAILIMGAGGGFSEGVSMAIISDLYGGARRTAMMNWSQFVFSVGAVSAPLVVAYLLRIGARWQAGYLFAAVICIISAIIALAGVAARKEKPLGNNEQSENWRKVFSNRLIFWLSVGILLYVGAEQGQSTWLAAYFKQILRSAGPLAASSVAFFWGGIGLGRACATWISKYLSDVSLICWALFGAAVSEAILLLVHSSSAGLFAVFALGFFLAPVWPTILSLAGAAYPDQSGLVFGIVVASGSLGGAIFPALIGRASDQFGFHTSLWMFFIILIMNFTIFINIRRSKAAAP